MQTGFARPPVGLCATCRHARIIQSDRGARFYRCLRADTDRRYARYPVLPVTICQGHELARDVPLPEPTP